MSARPGVEAPGDDAAATPSAPAAPVENKPINAIALAQEVVLEQVERLLTWLLARLRGYRARRGDWWER